MRTTRLRMPPGRNSTISVPWEHPTSQPGTSTARSRRGIQRKVAFTVPRPVASGAVLVTIIVHTREAGVTHRWPWRPQDGVQEGKGGFDDDVFTDVGIRRQQARRQRGPAGVARPSGVGGRMGDQQAQCLRREAREHAGAIADGIGVEGDDVWPGAGLPGRGYASATPLEYMHQPDTPAGATANGPAVAPSLVLQCRARSSLPG